MDDLHVPPEKVTDDDLLNCELEIGLWKCPVLSCAKLLSRKQTLRSHIVTCHALSCETKPKRYKRYEVDSSIPIPKSTYFLQKRQQSIQTNRLSSCTEVPSVSGVEKSIDQPLSSNLQENEEESDFNESQYFLDQTEDIFTESFSISDCSDMDISSDEASLSNYSSEIENSDVEPLDSPATGSSNRNDPPLYVIENKAELWNSSITKSEHHLAVSAFACRHNLSDIGLKHLLDLIQLHLPVNNIGETSVAKIKELCGFDETALRYHFYCNFCKKLFSEGVNPCQTPGCTGQQSDSKCKSYFLTSCLKTQVREVLQRDGIWEAILYARLESSKPSVQLCDIQCGSVYKKLLEPGGFLQDSNNITFSLFTDGVPLFKSSGISIWPVYLLINELPPKERFHRKNMLLWGVWQGVGKPNMNMFLKPLVLDLLELYDNGMEITISDKVLLVKAMLILATMDLPARAGVLNMTQHNGMYGCLYCMEPGMTVPSGKGHCHVYPVREEEPERRTDAAVKISAKTARVDGKRTDGFFGESVLLYLPYFSLTNFVVIDYMHGILLGITKLFLGLWFDTKYGTEPYNICHQITNIDKLLRNIHPPYMIHRHPRILSKTYQHWKASELRNWLLFYSIPCLRGYLPDVYLTHFSCLVEGTYLLLGEGISQEDVCRAHLLFTNFVRNISNLYHLRIMGINVHNLMHLVQCVKQFGPLWGFSCFAFESFNGELKRSVHGTGNVCKQMFWVLQAQKRIEQKSRAVADGDGKRFLKSMLGETTRLSGRTEAYQCYVGKLKPIMVNFSAELKSLLCDATGSCDISQIRKTSKISRNGFLMYSCSSKRTHKQNSYTIALETGSRDDVMIAIEVDFYLVKLDSMKVFAVGKLMESKETILPRRVPHLKVLQIRPGETVVKAEELREPLVVIRRDGIIHAAYLPNQFERD